MKECKPLLFSELLEHVKSHNKVITLDHHTKYWILMSEMMIYGPKTIIFNENIIQVHCSIFYDRKFETRLVIKACIIGHKSETSNVVMKIKQWNMLNRNYSEHRVELESSPIFDPIDHPDTLILSGMKNYMYETPDSSFLMEHKAMDDKIPTFNLKLHPYDSGEECQEIHTFTISFQTCN